MTNLKETPVWRKNILIIYLLLGIFLGAFPVFESQNSEAKIRSNEFFLEEISDNLLIVGDNSLLPMAPSLNLKVRKIGVVVTGYSSSPWETDDNPFLTAAGTSVRDGIVANNLLPFGTEIRVPELYGRKTFVVEDRMHWKKGYYHVDIWFPSYLEALNFGTKRTYIEILEI